MPSAELRPVLYLKDSCPHCLKLRLFLLEAGIASRFDVRSFAPGDTDEAAIRAELAPYFVKPSFPTVRIATGHYMAESDDIIDYYARAGGIDASSLPLLHAYRGVLSRYQAARRELKEIKAA